MPSLYELSVDLKELESLEFDEIELEQVEQIKDVIKFEIENKSSSIISLIRNIDTDILAVDNEIKRLQSIKKSKENKIENLKKYIKVCLEEIDIKKVDTALGKISIRNNAPKLIIDNIDDIDSKFVIVETTLKADKKAIKDSLKAGDIVNGCHLEQETSLIIK